MIYTNFIIYLFIHGVGMVFIKCHTELLFIANIIIIFCLSREFKTRRNDYICRTYDNVVLPKLLNYYLSLNNIRKKLTP